MPGDTEDYRIPITADVSELLAGFQEAGDHAEELGHRMSHAGEEAGEGMHHAAEESESAFGEMKESLESAIENVQKLSQGFAGLARIGEFAAVGEVIHMISEALAEGSIELEMFASRTQMSLSESNEWIASMEAMGLPANAISMAMRKLSSDIGTGGKKLHELGIEITDSEGKTRSLGEVYNDVAEKLATYGNNAKEAADAQELLGRSGQILVQTHEVQKEMMEELATVSKAVGANVQELTEQGNQQRIMETLVNEAWHAFATAIAPAVVGGLKVVATAAIVLEGAFQGLLAATKVLGEALEALAKTASQVFGAIVAQVSSTAAVIKDAATFDFGQLAKDAPAAADATRALGDVVLHVGDNFKKVGDDWNSMLKENTARQEASSKAIEHIWDGTWDRLAKKQADAMSAGVSGAGAPDLSPAKAKKVTDPMAGLENALDSANHKMAELQSKFDDLGSEAKMAGKEGVASFNELRDIAADDYEVMKQKYKEFTDAVESGSKEAAQKADKEWARAAQDFEKAWAKAKQKAEQDMKEIKSVADSMANDVSGILNGAISGKLNWAQEFDKILSKMLSSLIKHLAEQIAMWAAHEAQVNTIKATGGATGLALQKSQDNQAGQSSAVTAAKGAYASASQIPYIGWIIGPIAAAAAFAGVEAFGAAEGGFDVPPGLSPLTQLHPRELVLPANLAEGVRDMTSGGGSAGTGGNVSQNFNIQAWDGQSVIETLLGNGRAIGSAVQSAMRSGMTISGHG